MSTCRQAFDVELNQFDDRPQCHQNESTIMGTELTGMIRQVRNLHGMSIAWRRHQPRNSDGCQIKKCWQISQWSSACGEPCDGNQTPRYASTWNFNYLVIVKRRMVWILKRHWCLKVNKIQWLHLCNSVRDKDDRAILVLLVLTFLDIIIFPDFGGLFSDYALVTRKCF